MAQENNELFETQYFEVDLSDNNSSEGEVIFVDRSSSEEDVNLSIISSIASIEESMSNVCKDSVYDKIADGIIKAFTVRRRNALIDQDDIKSEIVSYETSENRIIYLMSFSATLLAIFMSTLIVNNSDVSSSKNSSIERVRVSKIIIERVSSEYLKILSSTRAFFKYSSNTRVSLSYKISFILA